MANFEPKQFGKYLLLEKIAVGGMAEIYKAKTYGVDGFEKELAIKRILPHCSADKDFVTMLADEAKLSVLLSHANIVQVYDLGKVGDDYYISMEFIHGPNLRDIIYRCREDKTHIPIDISLYIASEICKGLDYAHRKTDHNNRPLHIVHRDVSPQNVLISYEGEVKIVDFGIAKAAMNISHTMAGILKGKIAYMSPEQAMGSAVDHRTDIFSTGILLYEMLTGTKLFTGESQFEVLKKIRTTQVTPESLPETIPDPLKEVVAKALAYRPEDRYQNAGDLQVDLTKYLYSTHNTFSSRKLASFIRKTFKDEIKQDRSSAAMEAAIRGQTASMNIAEGAKQFEIVQRGPSFTPSGEDRIMKGGTDRISNSMVTPAEGIKIESTEKTTASHKMALFRNWWLFAFLAVVVVGAVAYAAMRFIPTLKLFEEEQPAPPSPPAIEFSSARINSSPDQASIYLDAVDTGKRTPALLERLEIGKSYSLELKREGYQDAFDTLRISSKDVVDVNLTLREVMGSLTVITDPPGAAILLNGRATGLMTPATIEDVPLNTDQRLTLSKPDYLDFEQVINLSSAKPQKVSTMLESVKKKGGKIAVTSVPSGALVFIDGKDSGRTTPTTLMDLEPKAYDISLLMQDYDNWSQKIDVEVGKTSSINAQLVKKTPEPPPPPPAEVKPPKEEPKEPPKEEPKEEPPTEPAKKEPEVTKGPAEVKPASLKITSTPSGARIFVDGKDTGKLTPADIVDLKLGATYSLRLDLDGFKKTYRKKAVARESDSVHVTMEKEVPVVPKAEEPQQPPPPPPREEVTRPAVSGEPGKIKISSKPSGADVFINYESKGKTPTTVTVPPGDVHVMVSQEGRSRFAKTVKVEPGKTISLTGIVLGDLYGEVLIKSTPPRAEVIFDGQMIPARTPVTVRKVRTDKSHSISVQMSGYRTWSTSFDMQGNDRRTIDVTLQPQ